MEQKIDFNEFFQKCMISPANHSIMDQLANSWNFFDDNQKKILIMYYSSLDTVASNENQGGDSKNPYMLKLWKVLGKSGRKTILDITGDLQKDSFYDAIFQTYGVNVNSEACQYFNEIGYSKKDIANIYLHSRYFDRLPKSELEKRNNFIQGLGISEELIKSNPLLFTMTSETLYAKIKYLESKGTDFSAINQENVDKLVTSEVEFEKEYGDLIRLELWYQNPNLYYSLFPDDKKMPRHEQISSVLRGIRKLYPLTEEIYEKIMDKTQSNTEKEELEISEDVALKDLDITWLMPKEKGHPKKQKEKSIINDSATISTQSLRESDGLTPEELERELKIKKEAENFKGKLIDYFGEEAKVRKYRYSKGGSHSLKIYTTYLQLSVGEYTILEPVGQYGNATYVVPTVLLGALDGDDGFGRKEVRSSGIGFRIYHDNDINGEYDYSSDHVLKLAESLKHAQEINHSSLSASELIDTVARTMNIQERKEELLSSQAVRMLMEECVGHEESKESLNKVIKDVKKVKSKVRKDFYNDPDIE